MKRNRPLLFIFALLLLPLWSGAAVAESKRIEVYALSQHYWDTQHGETLGNIARQLLPNNPRMHQRLMQDIVALNPDAFIDNDPDRMKAGTRLWLPEHMSKADTRVDPARTRVETYSWGNIKRPRQ